VVVGIAHVFVIGVGSDRIDERTASSIDDGAIAPRVDLVFPEGSTCRRPGSDVLRLAQAETESGHSWVRSVNRQQIQAQRALLGLRASEQAGQVRDLNLFDQVPAEHGDLLLGGEIPPFVVVHRSSPLSLS